MLDMVNAVTRRNIINHIHRLRDMTWLTLGMGMLDLNVSNQYIRWSSFLQDTSVHNDTLFYGDVCVSIDQEGHVCTVRNFH